MSVAVIKKGDTNRALTDVLTLDGSPINLTGFTVVCVLKRHSNSAIIRKAASITAPASNGAVSCLLGSPETDTAETFDQEWECTSGGGGVLTVPDDQVNVVRVVDDLG